MGDHDSEAFRLARRRFLRLSAALVAGAVSPALLAACGGAPATNEPAAGGTTEATAGETPAAVAEGSGGTLVFAAEAIQGNLEPGAFYSFGDWQAIDLVGRGLVFFDYQKDAKVQPALAESWTLSDDGTIYTFEMKQGLTFHDGTPVTATAVKRSFNRLLDEKDPARPQHLRRLGDRPHQCCVDRGARRANRGDHAQAARRGLPQTHVEPQRDHPQPGRARQVRPQHRPELVAAGPFKLDRIAANQEVELSAFDGFYAGRPKLDRIVIRATADETTIVSSQEAGETQLTNSAPISALAQLRANPNLKVEVGVPWIDIFMSLNPNIAPFDDKRVRQAKPCARCWPSARRPRSS